jgi:sec-independent protein translocase protein TatA
MMNLFLSDIAGSEILLILVFILIFFGSKSIPGIARTFGRTIRQIKDASQELQSEIKKSGLDIKNDLNLNRMIEETAQEIQAPLDQMAIDLDESIKYEKPKNHFVEGNHIPDLNKNEIEIKEQIEIDKEKEN